MYAAQTQRIVVVDVYNDDNQLNDHQKNTRSPPPLLSPKRCDDFVTVLQVDDHLPPPCTNSNFVTVLQVDAGTDRDNSVEEVSIYRLPGERLGMALKFEGGVNVSDTVSRVFIQSINLESPAARARCDICPLKDGDEILRIDDKDVSSMTRIDCVSILRDAPVCIRLLVRHQPTDSPYINGVEENANQQPKKKGPPPPVPPRKTSYVTKDDKALEGVRDIIQRLEKQQNADKTGVKRPSQPPPLPPRRPRTEIPDDFQSEKATFPGSTVSMRLPGWEELMLRRAERLDRDDTPVLADVTIDLLAEEELHYIESESDDTGSTVSTVIEKFSRGSTANSSFSEHVHSLERPAPFDLKQVLSPFERLERELDGEDTALHSDGVVDHPMDTQKNVHRIFNCEEGLGVIAIEPPELFQDGMTENEFNSALSPPGDSGFCDDLNISSDNVTEEQRNESVLKKPEENNQPESILGESVCVEEKCVETQSTRSVDADVLGSFIKRVGEQDKCNENLENGLDESRIVDKENSNSVPSDECIKGVENLDKSNDQALENLKDCSEEIRIVEKHDIRNDSVFLASIPTNENNVKGNMIDNVSQNIERNIHKTNKTVVENGFDYDITEKTTDVYILEKVGDQNYAVDYIVKQLHVDKSPRIIEERAIKKVNRHDRFEKDIFESKRLSEISEQRDAKAEPDPIESNLVEKRSTTKSKTEETSLTESVTINLKRKSEVISTSPELNSNKKVHGSEKSSTGIKITEESTKTKSGSVETEDENANSPSILEQRNHSVPPPLPPRLPRTLPTNRSSPPETNTPVSPATLRSKIPRPTFPTSPLSSMATFSERNHFSFDKRNGRVQQDCNLSTDVAIENSKSKSKEAIVQHVNHDGKCEESRSVARTTASRFGFIEKSDNRKGCFKAKRIPRAKDAGKTPSTSRDNPVTSNDKTKPTITDSKPVFKECLKNDTPSKTTSETKPKEETVPQTTLDPLSPQNPVFWNSTGNSIPLDLDNSLDNIFDEMVNGHDDVRQFRVEVGVTNEEERHFLCSDAYLDESTFTWNLSRWPLQDVPEEDEPMEDLSEKVEKVCQVSSTENGDSNDVLEELHMNTVEPPEVANDDAREDLNIAEETGLPEDIVSHGVGETIDFPPANVVLLPPDICPPPVPKEEAEIPQNTQDIVQEERKKFSESSETSEESSSAESDVCSVLEAVVQRIELQETGQVQQSSIKREEHVSCVEEPQPAMEILIPPRQQTGNSIFDDSLIPPTFSRLPPDGHEFPPSYSEPPDLSQYNNSNAEVKASESSKSTQENMPSIDETVTPFYNVRGKASDQVPTTNVQKQNQMNYNAKVETPIVNVAWKSEENLMTARKYVVYGRDRDNSISVKDRIAMFSKENESAVMPKPVVNGYVSKPVSSTDSIDSHMLSTVSKPYDDTVLKRDNKWHSMISLSSEENLDTSKPLVVDPKTRNSTENLLKAAKDSPEFIRPKTVSSYPETQLTNHRRYSYGSLTFGRGGDDFKKPSSTLFSLLEARKQNAKKLKGLVIPEKPSAASSVLKPLPTILSCNSLLNSSPRHEWSNNRANSLGSDPRKQEVNEQNAKNRSFSMVAAESQWKVGFAGPVTRQQSQPAYKCHAMELPRTPVSSSVSPTPPSSLTSPLSPPPSSPSSVCSSNTSSSCGTQKQVFQFSLSHSKPVTPTLPEKPIMSPVPLSTSSSDYEADSSEVSLPLTSSPLPPIVPPPPQPTIHETIKPPPIPKKAPPSPQVLSITEDRNSSTNGMESYTPMVNGGTCTPNECEERITAQQLVPVVESLSQQSKMAVERLDTLVGLSLKTETKEEAPLDSDVFRAKPVINGSQHVPNDIENGFGPKVPKSEPPQTENRSFWSNGIPKTLDSEDDDNNSVISQRTEDSRQTADDSLSDATSDSAVVDPEFKPRRISQQQTVLRTYKDSADSVKNFRALAEKWQQRAGEEAKSTHPLLARKDSGKHPVLDGTMKLPPSLMPRGSDPLPNEKRKSISEPVDDRPPVLTRRAKTELHQSRLLNGDATANGYLKKYVTNGTDSVLEKNRMNLSRSASSMSINLPPSINSVFSRNARSVSVSDIRKAFENSSTQQNGTATPPTKTTNSIGPVPQRRASEDRSVTKEPSPKILTSEHRRFSSIDSTDSGTSTPGSLGTSGGHGDLYGSVTSLASTGSLISPQELQQLIDEANQSLEESSSKEIIVVVLHKDIPSGGIGVTLAGGADYETKEITVHKIITGSLADRDGRIRKGDRLMSINGRNVRGVTHREALDILKSPRAEVVLVISREKIDDGFDSSSKKEKTQSFSTPVPVAAEDNINGQEKPTTPTSGNAARLLLFKDGTGLGFSLEGGKDSPFGDKPLTVKRIFKGGAADREGQLKIGDEIITFNDQPVANMTRTEAWNYMKKLPDGQVTMTIRQCI